MGQTHAQQGPLVPCEGFVARPLALVLEAWTDAFPWLVQGTTTRGTRGRPMDFGLRGESVHSERVLESWRHLLDATGMTRGVQARQVHGCDVAVHGPEAPDVGRPGRARVDIVGSCDAHVSREPGLLLAVTTADCVPAFLVEPERRAVAVVHAGWRGVAAGVMERALEALSGATGARASDFHLHLGPAICGRCYEVGPEVFSALGLPAPVSATPIDLRAVLARRAIVAGVPSARVSVSAHCTRCTGSGLYSHRGGDVGRQVGYIGVRA